MYLVFLCDSEAIRTLDPRLRRALLYPAELRNPVFVGTKVNKKNIFRNFYTQKIVRKDIQQQSAEQYPLLYSNYLKISMHHFEFLMDRKL